jgi:dTDP-4-amino-4,6-dideoxygalactose transaminase
MIVHYFGFPAEIEKARRFCKEHGLALIEDAAHSFLSTIDGRYLGTFGDIGIYSMRKMVPIPNGGALVLGQGKGDRSLIDLDRLSAEPDGRRLIALLGRYVESHAGFPFPRLPGLSPAVNYSVVTKPDSRKQLADYGFSPWSMRILCRIDLADVARRRRENYQFLTELLPFSRAVSLLWSRLPAGVCPQALPLLTAKRDVMAKALRDRGVEAHGWPSMPPEVDQHEFRGAAELADKVLLLPIHQELGRGAATYIAQTVSAVLEYSA